MKAKTKTRFDTTALREIAGGTVFARGEAYHRDGQVEILAIDSERVLAQVAGSEGYRTELTGQGRDIDGECSCRAFEDHGFCKHLVATALAANDLSAEATAGGGALARIRNHLKEKGVDALVDIIVGLAEQDLVLFRKLDVAAAALDEDEKTLTKRLRKAIDNATRTPQFIDYREGPSWAANVDSALDMIASLASGERAGIAQELALHALDRIGQAMEGIDDSDGHCGALSARAGDIHLAAVRQIKPDPVELARELFALEMADEYETFDGAVRNYADLLGEAGLAEYRRLATKAWDKSARSAGGKGEDVAGDRYRVTGILDFFAERDGDVDARIALRATDLSSPWSYLQLAEFCLSQGRKEEALRRAEEGLWIFEDGRQDARLVLFVADLLSKAGRKPEAAAHLWRLFKKEPTFELYTRLCKIAGNAAREEALAFLEAWQASGARKGWQLPNDLLLRIWIHEKNFDAAWVSVRQYGASTGLKEELAGKCEATHPREVLEVYAARVEDLANGGHGYDEAAKLVKRMAKLRESSEHLAYVQALKERFKRKRNFMKLLN